MNRVDLIGRLVRDPELRMTNNGIAVTSFRLAVDREFTDQNGQHGADFIDIVCWRKQAENVNKYMTKGRRLAVSGRLQTRNYESQDGQKRTAVEVVADHVEFIDWGTGNQATGGTHNSTGSGSETDPSSYGADVGADNDLPF
jgi:single-strand DNA-binding protein